jgi:hypothetical protein
VCGALDVAELDDAVFGPLGVSRVDVIPDYLSVDSDPVSGEDGGPPEEDGAEKGEENTTEP